MLFADNTCCLSVMKQEYLKVRVHSCNSWLKKTRQHENLVPHALEEPLQGFLPQKYLNQSTDSYETSTTRMTIHFLRYTTKKCSKDLFSTKMCSKFVAS